MEMINSVPYFQISMPVNYEKWETGYTPLVGYVPQGIDESEIETVTCFDSEGNVYYLNAKEEPDFPVLILGVNERVDSKIQSTVTNNKLNISLSPLGGKEVIFRSSEPASNGVYLFGWLIYK